MADNLKDKIEKYVTGLFEQNPAPGLKFHNLYHTKNVVKNAMSVAGHCNVSESEMFMLNAAAWFHDTGYLFTEPQYHEKESCVIMENFMSEKVNDITVIDKIKQCIMATKVPQQPQSMLQNILCDADLYHLGSAEFPEINQRVFEEQVLKSGKVDTMKFNNATLKMLKDHRFFTNYCREVLSVQKEKNIAALQKKITDRKTF